MMVSASEPVESGLDGGGGGESRVSGSSISSKPKAKRRAKSAKSKSRKVKAKPEGESLGVIESETEPESEQLTDDSDKGEEEGSERKSQFDGEGEESEEWAEEHKKHESRGRRKKKLIRLVVVAVALIVISSVSFVYFYYETFDFDGDGILDWDDDDDDGDGMPDKWEKLHNFDPLDPDDGKADPDSDNLTNKEEYFQDTDPHNSDTDCDGLLDGAEITHRSDPLINDTDNDGMLDGWEVEHKLNPTDEIDANADPDHDGPTISFNGDDIYINYTNFQEYQNDTNPNNPDTDGDLIFDGWELYYNTEIEKIKMLLPSYNYTFNPRNGADGALDIDIDFDFNLAPDELTNSEEFLNGTNPLRPDTDGDELPDGAEVKIYNTDPNWYDTDSDLLSDAWEVLYSLNPLSTDTDGDSINDSQEDEDFDQLSNHQEYGLRTNPNSNDTDEDGMTDGWEVEHELNPLVPDHEDDPDGDLLPNYLEKIWGTNPHNPDTDNDSLTDGEEARIGWRGELRDGVYSTGPNATRYFSDPLSKDSDKDKVSDYFEIRFYHTNATNNDTDEDTMFDWYELNMSFTNPSKADSDSDGINDAEELNATFGYFTIPTSADTDKDGLNDGNEIFTDFYPGTPVVDGTDPTIPDSDSDGMPDGWEAQYGKTKDYDLIQTYDIDHGTSLLLIADPNFDTVVEVPVWLINPRDASDKEQDPDHDSYGSFEYTNIKEYQEYNIRFGTEGKYTDPLDSDTDGDKMSDGWEILYTKNNQPDPLNGSDADSNPDHDGVIYHIKGAQYQNDFTNIEEYLFGTDTNEDGIIDTGASDPNDHDADNNGKPDFEEFWYTDHDGDGLFTGWELLFNGTPLSGEGYLPKFSGGLINYFGKFNPYDNDSDDDSTLDGEEDPDGDSIKNSVEHGTYDSIRNKSGSSDPTDETSIPSRSSSRAEPLEISESDQDTLFFEYNSEFICIENSYNRLQKKK